MATAPASETVHITINDVELAVPAGELIVESVKRLGLEIPIFCYHSRLKPVGMCRMCLVEVGFRQPDGTVRKMPKPQAGCTLPASEGMAVYTDSEMVHKDRRGVLEFLLINHPLDCPICDRGGECPLQNNTLFYGPSTSRFLEMKRHALKAFPLSKYVTLDLERCIQCGRCVRFTEEISGDSDLAFRFRGSEMQPSTFELTDFTSKFSGNVIEICPVGALTSGQYRFRARPWDLETKESICTVCSNGCSVWFDHRVGRFVRINGRTNDAINEEWTCDRGKFGHDYYNSEKRLTHPLIRKGGQFVQATWAEAYEKILDAFAVGGNEVACLVEPDFSNEGLYLLQKLFRTSFKSNNIDSRWTRTLPTAADRLESKMGVRSVQTRIAAFETSPVIFVFGTSLSDDEPILYLRVRKAWSQNGATVIVAHDSVSDTELFAEHSMRFKPGTGHILAAGLLNLLVSSGKASVPPATREAISGFTAELVEEQTGVPAHLLKQVAEKFPGAKIITTDSIFNSTKGQECIETLAGIAMTTDGEFNCYALNANGQGAAEIGFAPDMLPGGRLLSSEADRAELSSAWGADVPTQAGVGTHQIIDAAAKERLKSLWLVNVDPFDKIENRELVERALENTPFLVYQGVLESEAMGYASVVLPMAAPAEQDGSFTNLEGTVQRILPAIPPPGEAKPAWRIFVEAAMRSNPGTPYFNPSEVMSEMAKLIPAFANSPYESGAIEALAESGADPIEPVPATAVTE